MREDYKIVLFAAAVVTAILALVFWPEFQTPRVFFVYSGGRSVPDTVLSSGYEIFEGHTFFARGKGEQACIVFLDRVENCRHVILWSAYQNYQNREAQLAKALKDCK